MSWKAYQSRYNAGTRGGRLEHTDALELEDRRDLLEGVARVFEGARSTRLDDRPSRRAALEAVADSVGTLGLQKFEAVDDDDRLELARALVELYGPTLLELLENQVRRMLGGGSHLLIAPSDLAELNVELEALVESDPHPSRAASRSFLGLRALERPVALGTPTVADLRHPFVDLVNSLEGDGDGDGPAASILSGLVEAGRLFGLVWHRPPHGATFRGAGIPLAVVTPAGAVQPIARIGWSTEDHASNPFTWSEASRETFESTPSEVFELAVSSWRERERLRTLGRVAARNPLRAVTDQLAPAYVGASVAEEARIVGIDTGELFPPDAGDPHLEGTERVRDAWFERGAAHLVAALEGAGVEITRDESRPVTWFRRGDQSAMISDLELATGSPNHLAELLDAAGLLGVIVDLGEDQAAEVSR